MKWKAKKLNILLISFVGMSVTTSFLNANYYYAISIYICIYVPLVELKYAAKWSMLNCYLIKTIEIKAIRYAFKVSLMKGKLRNLDVLIYIETYI